MKLHLCICEALTICMVPWKLYLLECTTNINCTNIWKLFHQRRRRRRLLTSKLAIQIQLKVLHVELSEEPAHSIFLHDESYSGETLRTLQKHQQQQAYLLTDYSSMASNPLSHVWLVCLAFFCFSLTQTVLTCIAGSFIIRLFWRESIALLVMLYYVMSHVHKAWNYKQVLKRWLVAGIILLGTPECQETKIHKIWSLRQPLSTSKRQS